METADVAYLKFLWMHEIDEDSRLSMSDQASLRVIRLFF